MLPSHPIFLPVVYLFARPLRPLLLACGLLLCFSCLAPEAANAQSRRGDVGLGGQVGEPSGLTLKAYQRPGFAYDFLAAWDLDNFFFLNVHGLYERPLQDSPLRYYYGPGVLLGVRDGRDGDDLTLGLSASFGLNFFIEQFEVYLQLTPRLHLVPETDGAIGGGVGLRYYFE